MAVLDFLAGLTVIAGLALALNLGGLATGVAKLSGELPSWFVGPRFMVRSPIAWRLAGLGLVAFGCAMVANFLNVRV